MKYIKDWERILLDTTVLCSLFRSEKTTSKNSDDLFVRKLMEFLNSTKTGASKERIFLISAVTIAELTTNEENSEKIKRILRVLDSKNVEFIDFDLDVAIAFNAHLKPYLNSDNLHEIAKAIGFKTNDFVMAREWITKDFMIAMTGIENRSDVILTADKNTFYVVAKNIGNSNCVLTYSDLFEQGEKSILRYKENEVEQFVKTKHIQNDKQGKNNFEEKVKNKEEVNISAKD